MSNIILPIVSLIIAIGGVSVFSLYSSRKTALINHIQELLKDLRSMDSWDDRSELKLFQWLENSDERTLHYRGLLELRSILDSLYTYWAIHAGISSGNSAEEADRFQFNPKKWRLTLFIKELFFPDKPRLLV